jgi:dienelactone hydrolase
MKTINPHLNWRHRVATPTLMVATTIVAWLWCSVAGSLAKPPEREPGESSEQAGDRLAGTEPLTWPTPLDARMRAAAHRFIAQKTEQSLTNRQQYWSRVFSSASAYAQSIEPNRQRFRRLIGVVDPRLPVVMERFGDDANPALVAETETYRVFQVRWPVLANIYQRPAVNGEGLLLEPKATPKAGVVVLPDADQTPEQLVGLAPGVAPDSQFARRLAENGVEVVIPVLLNRAVYAYSQPAREWIYRQAFHMGRHVLGYEVQKVLAALDWLAQRHGPELKLGVAGYAEGGLIAFYAAALDTRVSAALVSGYFDSRQNIGQEPMYRTVWGLLREFGDAEIASLIAPRGLVVEYSLSPEVRGQTGKWTTPKYATAQAEFERIGALLKPDFQPRVLISAPDNKPISFGSSKALEAFAGMLGTGCQRPLSKEAPTDRRARLDVAARHSQQVKGMEDHVQGLVFTSLTTRNAFYLYKVQPELGDFSAVAKLPPLDQRAKLRENFIEKSKWYRQYAWEEVFGKVTAPYLPLNPRSRKYQEDPKWVAYDVVLDVWPDVFACGLLLVPKDIAPGQRRPTVVVQHGWEGTPYEVIDRKRDSYFGVAARLADRGFVVFCPQNLYRGGDDYRALDKEARAVKLSMWSLMLGQHERILTWLGGLPCVDPARIGFYGCSYGGLSAVYLPPLLEKYCLSISSANFNDWTSMIASTRGAGRASYMTRPAQWELAFFDMGNTFSHAELAYLMAPRPFMVEHGMYDPVAYDWQVAAEYARVRWLYTQLGIPDQTTIEFRNGPHGFLCQESFKFLHQHLNWPEPKTE